MNFNKLEIDIEDMLALSKEEFANSRRQGFGTSDSSILLDVNPFENLTSLINKKTQKGISEEELAVGELPAVRKGSDLEPLILKKWSEAFGLECTKPTAQYSHKVFPFLKFNFDGIATVGDDYIPVEAKVVTRYGLKYYDFTKAQYIEKQGFNTVSLSPHPNWGNLTIKQRADSIGIPAYYYTQVQQQIFGLEAPYGYLAVLNEADWKLYVYLVPRDEETHRQLILQSNKAWQQVEQRRGK